jgi:hypothetical protein
MGRLNEDDLFRRAGVHVPPDGGLRLLDPADVDAVLDAAEASGTQILGIEGFRRLDDGVQPEMDAILDLSSMSDATESVRASRRFMSNLGIAGLVYDLTVADPDADPAG